MASSSNAGTSADELRSLLACSLLYNLPYNEGFCSTVIASGQTPLQGQGRKGMATTDVSLHAESRPPEQEPVVNDFSIQVATVNGSGSQSANNVLLRSIFRMGIPVSGKNLFPSNIAGLPTWYTIRASKHGYVARKKEIDVLIAMNAETAKEDVISLSPVRPFYDEPLSLGSLRTDLTFYAIPYDKIVATVCPDAKLRKLVKNVIYVGVAAQILQIDMSASRQK